MKTGRIPLYQQQVAAPDYIRRGFGGGCQRPARWPGLVTEAKPRRELSPAAARGPLYLNMKQAAAYLNISEPTFKKLRDAGKIPYQKFGRRTYRVSREALDRWLAKEERKMEKDRWRG